MLFLFIIRRLNPRLRAIVGVSVIFVGVTLLGLAATVASWLLIHGIIASAGRHRLLHRGLPSGGAKPMRLMTIPLRLATARW